MKYFIYKPSYLNEGYILYRLNLLGKIFSFNNSLANIFPLIKVLDISLGTRGFGKWNPYPNVKVYCLPIVKDFDGSEGIYHPAEFFEFDSYEEARLYFELLK